MEEVEGREALGFWACFEGEVSRIGWVVPGEREREREEREPRMFQEGIMSLKEASRPLLQCKGCKLRCFQGQTSSADGEGAGRTGRPVSRVGTAQLQPSGAMGEGQDFQVFHEQL